MVSKMLLLLLRIYQKWISPLYPARCRYSPTCSQYAVEAITKYGALKGVRLAFWRIVRCHPWCRGGHDPVP